MSALNMKHMEFQFQLQQVKCLAVTTNHSHPFNNDKKS